MAVRLVAPFDAGGSETDGGQHAVGFDPLERATSLAASCREMGLEDEARWWDDRARFLVGT